MVTTQPNQRRKQGRAHSLGMASEQREYEAIMAQIKNIMLLANEEPPQGEDEASIAKRIDLLQQALGALEQRAKDNQLMVEVMRTNLLNKRQERLVETAQQRQEKLSKKLEEREKFIHLLQEDRKYMLSQKHEVADSRMGLVQENAYNLFTTAHAKAEAERQRREKAVERIYEERARAVKEHRDRTQQREDQNREALLRQKKQEKLQRRQRELEIQEHDKYVAKRQYEADRKQQEAMREQWQPYLRNGASSANALQRCGSGMTAHEAARQNLMDELKEKEKQHQERYEEEQITRRYEIERRAYKHKERQERQRQRYSQQLDERIKRGDEIIAKAQEKKRRAEKAQENRQKQESDAGAAFARDVEEHRKRAEAIQLQRREKFLRQNYLRWNERAALVMQHLQDVFPPDGRCTLSGEKPCGFLPTLAPFLVNKRGNHQQKRANTVGSNKVS
ncbi:hypothetical protein, conserved [Trypanosoma brucei gambiense DAL972]|uniref:Uncharacterized protein n=1 Tax=Trypanosoma brucei gambiense (strain MHOM/CI/86/DAL972) TaxID=679716 RepID=D0A5R3_TRYB9|nr:hypothetical protein, conserved [Trypanosoma brucei gambiense DAL972]CBH17014.1 hypothetical protein, conserved [Trypanosoma brucei gambiense DAL972]|eukprot:XP_011779278.1 hypothetical protein, conserved [Trypanosoma brucei gambiense DAL972]